MKTKAFTAISLAAIFCMFTFFKCGPDNPPLTIKIAGEWRIDSLYPTYKTTDSMRQEIALRLDNEKKKKFIFHADSSFIKESLTDSSSGRYYVRNGELYLDDTNGAYPYHILVLSDTAFYFLNKDNMMFRLKRK